MPPLAERERVLRTIRAHKPLCARSAFPGSGFSARWPVVRPAAASDVDVMIAIPPGRKFSLFDLGEVRVELCELLGREVDVVIEQDLEPGFRSDILVDLVQVF